MRRTNNRDDRRRRVLTDERVLSTERESPPNDGASRKTGPTPRYTEAALVDQQPRICDFLPIRPWTLLLWFLVGTTFVVGHATLFVLERTYGLRAGVDLAPMRMTGPQTLSSWSSSFLLLASAVCAAIIVQFRRHRIDDYRGEYRVWYYFVVALVLASINASIGGHRIAWDATHQATKALEISHAGIWINGLISVFVTCVGVRLLLEVRGSRGTVVTGLITASIYLLSWLVALDVIPMVTAELAALSAGLARLMSHFLLMMTLVVYARFVFMDAQGLISHVRSKKAKKKRTSSATVKTKTARTTRKPAAAKPKTTKSTQTEQPKLDESTPTLDDASDEDLESLESDEDDSPSTLRLSKAERRRMRKQKRRDRRAA